MDPHPVLHFLHLRSAMMLKWLLAAAAFFLVALLVQRLGRESPKESSSSIAPHGPTAPTRLGSLDELLIREPVTDGTINQRPDAGELSSTNLPIRIMADRTGFPVSGAVLSSDDGIRAESGQEGLVTLPRPLGGKIWSELKVERDGFASRTILVDWRDRDLLIRLREPGSIRGVVRHESGEPLSSKVDVVAWPVSGGHPTQEGLTSALRNEGLRSFIHVETDSAGAFEIPDLSPNEMYLVVAGRGGHVTRQYQRALVGGEDLDLRLTRVYALRVRLISASGEQIALDDPLIARREVSWWTDSEFAGTMDVSESIMVLAGIPDSYGDDGNAIVKAFYTSQDVPEIDCALEIECAGFAPARLTGVARPLDLGGAEYDLSLLETASGFGSVSLNPSGCAEALQRRAEQANVALSLMDEEGHTEIIRGSMKLNAVSVFSGIPVGEYRWTLEGETKLWKAPSTTDSRIVIRNDETTPIAIDMSHAAAISIRPMLDGGEYFSAPLSILVSPGSPTIEPDGKRKALRGWNLSLKKAPYLLPLIEAGEYTMRGSAPRFGPPAEGGWLTVSVAPGECLDVEVLAE